jgi:hypothetical protein
LVSRKDFPETILMSPLLHSAMILNIRSIKCKANISR